MLEKIHCDLFKIKDINLKTGLNIVKGPDNASNSIGKSTLLLIIDYCFGGESYGGPESDIIKNIGHHEIKFVFKFNNQKFHFARLTSEPNKVKFYSSDFNSNFVSIELKDFNAFLFEKYFNNLKTGTFRNLTSRFSRIYGKENLNEKDPLLSFKNEKQVLAISALESLFNYSDCLLELKKNLENIKKEKNAFIEAKKYNVISNDIKNKHTLNEKIKKLTLLKENKEEIILEQNNTYIIPETAYTSDSIELKLQLNELLKKRSRIKYKIKKINKDITNHSQITKDEINELTTFLPNTNIKKIKEIDLFQKHIFEILKSEINEELHLLTSELKILDNEIIDVEQKLKNLNIPQKITVEFISKISQLCNEINSIEKEIEIYDKIQDLSKRIKIAENELAVKESYYLESMSSLINEQMKIYNDYINDNLRKQPILTFKDGDHYKFITPDDTGTGTLYKNMLVLDISILKLSSLPFIIHDSLLFKNIADYPINKLIKIYNQFDKQIFISIDKVSSYNNPETTTIVDSNTIINLADGMELFGFSWGKKTI